MALNLNLASSPMGIAVQNAYFRMASVTIMRTRNPENKFFVMVDVAIYATNPADDEVKNIDMRRYHVPLTDIEAQFGTEFLSKCYNWVANQPDMEGSTPI